MQEPEVEHRSSGFPTQSKTTIIVSVVKEDERNLSPMPGVPLTYLRMHLAAVQ